MSQTCFWTPSKARLQWVRGKGYLQWIFVPGGPGLGSESLFPLFEILDLPGEIWRLDLPGDGSNIGSIEDWRKALLEAAGLFDRAIMAGHSRGGMFLLELPELEQKIAGLVLLDSAPDRSWHQDFSEKVSESPLPSDNVALREFVLEGAPYMFTEKFVEKGRKMLEGLPYNHRAIEWTLKHFDPTYSAQWIPQKIPTLILAGSEDLATPLKLFAEKQAFQRSNILLREIPHAGHFPWIENPEAVAAAFREYHDFYTQKNR